MSIDENPNGLVKLAAAKNNLNLLNETGPVEITNVFQHLLSIDVINENQYRELIKIIST